MTANDSRWSGPLTITAAATRSRGSAAAAAPRAGERRRGVLCYSLTGAEHWTDAYLGSGPHATVRARRRHLLAVILAARGLDYDDDPSGLTSIVSDRKGKTAVVRGLGEVWAAVEQLSERPGDPLDPTLLKRLAELAR